MHEKENIELQLLLPLQCYQYFSPSHVVSLVKQHFAENSTKHHSRVFLNRATMRKLNNSIIQRMRRIQQKFQIVLQPHFNSISQDHCVKTISISKSITTSFHLSLFFFGHCLKNMLYFLCVFLSSQALLHQVLS